ncbi:ankyrin repeat-containing protein at5g02620 [Phtheirospermum japonicum]|uniref:Ankyrin repeat-containing protein at5g02620 n=1 Tax=Phtheirospermum japonicum TaxID=374723 RepID=A0A830CFN4_9LAMI|nr:ankyrin repeat-containing protein at5g02620 [Phtheirospermum japonicum]
MEFLSLLDHDKQKQYHQTLHQQLHEAAIQGSVPILSQILQENPQYLRSSNFSISENPLHTAALLGHLNSKGSSALHLASAKGNVEIVRELVLFDNSMCRVLDGDGWSPLHLAAIKGRTEVLGELLAAELQEAAALTGGGESCLHLCVKYYRFEAMKVIIQFLKRDDVDRIIDWKDKGGNNVLHLAVAQKQIEIVKYLLYNTRIQRDARNANGSTPLDLLLQSPGDLRDLDIKQCLEQKNSFTPLIINSDISKAIKTSSFPKKHNQHTDWLARKRNALMIVASLLATVAFQAALSPPGGVWQSDSSGNPNGTTRVNKPHRAGQSVMAYTDPYKYGQYMIFNTIAFLASLSIILLQVSGLPMRRRRWMWTQMAIMWVAITAQTLTYFVTLISLTPKHVENSAYRVAKICVAVWLLLIGIVFVGNIAPSVLLLLRKYGYVEEKEMKGGVYEEDGEDDDVL